MDRITAESCTENTRILDRSTLRLLYRRTRRQMHKRHQNIKRVNSRILDKVRQNITPKKSSTPDRKTAELSRRQEILDRRKDKQRVGRHSRIMNRTTRRKAESECQIKASIMLDWIVEY